MLHPAGLFEQELEGNEQEGGWIDLTWEREEEWEGFVSFSFMPARPSCRVDKKEKVV